MGGIGVAAKVGLIVTDIVAVAVIVAVGVKTGVIEGVAVGVTLPTGVGVGGTQMGPADKPSPTSGPFTPICVMPMLQ